LHSKLSVNCTLCLQTTGFQVTVHLQTDPFLKIKIAAGHQRLTPVILATQEDHVSKPASTRPYLEIPFIKIELVELVEWLKVKALSSSPRTAKKTLKLSLLPPFSPLPLQTHVRAHTNTHTLFASGESYFNMLMKQIEI
jgi:hypothetical protein